MNRLNLISLLAGCAAIGCASYIPAYDPVGSHTLRVTAEQEADVVWVQKLDVAAKRSVLFRCHNSPSGPQCVEAKTP